MRTYAAALCAVFAVVPVGASAQGPPPSCSLPSFETLWPAVPEARRAGLVVDDEHTSTQLATIELDGAAPAEAVLAIDSLVSELESELGEPRSAVFVLRCVRGAWTLVGRVELAIDTGWDGTLDERPGVRVVRAETLPGVGHDFARIEHVDVRGSYDPRFVSRRLMLVHVVGDEVLVAFDAVVRTETVSGPDRAEGPTSIRRVVYRRTTPPRIRLRVSETSPNGRTRTFCRTELRFDGRTFVPADPSCR